MFKYITSFIAGIIIFGQVGLSQTTCVATPTTYTAHLSLTKPGHCTVNYDASINADLDLIDSNLTTLVSEVGNNVTTLNTMLPKSGGTMTGPLVLAADPTTALQAATKEYVDAHGGSTAVTPQFTIGTVTTLPAGSSATVSVTGTAANPILNLGIPNGSTGSTGATGATPTFTIGTVSTLTSGSSATVTITGTAPNYILNLGIPSGVAGSNGVTPTLAIGSTTTLPAGSNATVTVTGTPPNYVFNFGVPAGPSGAGSNLTFPSSGILFATSPSTFTAATSPQIVGILNTAPTTLLSASLIPVLNQNTLGNAATSTTSSNSNAINGVAISGSPQTGYVPIATGNSSATWSALPVSTATTLPSSGIVYATSPTTGTSATSSQIANALNTSPTTQLSTSLIPTLNQNTSGNAATSTLATTATSANQIHGVAVTGTPTSGQTIVATNSTSATWQTPTAGSGGAVLPSSGVVYATSSTTSTQATGDQIIAAVNNGNPSTTFSPNVISQLLAGNMPAFVGDASSQAGTTALTVTAVNGGGLPVGAPCIGTNSSQQIITTNCAGNVAGAPIGLNLAADFGSNNLKADGSDNSQRLRNILTGVGGGTFNTSSATQLNWPAGTYKFASPVVIDSLALTINCEGNPGSSGSGTTNIVASGNGMEAILKFEKVAGDAGGSFNNGVIIKGCNFTDGSSAGNLTSAIEIRDIENAHLRDITVQNVSGTQYSAGTASVQNGSTTVTCVTNSGCTWYSGMAPGTISIGGWTTEIISCTTNTCTMANQWQGNSGNLTSYTINQGGIGVWFAPGTPSNAFNSKPTYSFVQYNSVENYNGHTVRYFVFQSSGISGEVNSSEGSSRNLIIGGWRNCGLTDSIDIYGGVYTDTTKIIGSESNQCTNGILFNSSHSNQVFGYNAENYVSNYSATNLTVVNMGSTTCPLTDPTNSQNGVFYGGSGVYAYACTHAFVVIGGDGGSNGTSSQADNNQAFGIYCNLCGSTVYVGGGTGAMTGGAHPPRYTVISYPQIISNTTTGNLNGLSGDGTGSYCSNTGTAICGVFDYGSYTTLQTPKTLIHNGQAVY